MQFSRYTWHPFTPLLGISFRDAGIPRGNRSVSVKLLSTGIHEEWIYPLQAMKPREGKLHLCSDVYIGQLRQLAQNVQFRWSLTLSVLNNEHEAFKLTQVPKKGLGDLHVLACLPAAAKHYREWYSKPVFPKHSICFFKVTDIEAPTLFTKVLHVVLTVNCEVNYKVMARSEFRFDLRTAWQCFLMRHRNYQTCVSLSFINSESCMAPSNSDIVASLELRE